MSNIKYYFIMIFISFNVLAKSGETLYQRCIQCHGKDGFGNASLNAPRIAGQFNWYLESSLAKFKSGERTNLPMKPIIENLTQDDFKKLANYISSMK